MTFEALKRQVRDAVRLRTTGIPVWGSAEDGNARPKMYIKLREGKEVIVPARGRREA